MPRRYGEPEWEQDPTCNHLGEIKTTIKSDKSYEEVRMEPWSRDFSKEFVTHNHAALSVDSRLGFVNLMNVVELVHVLVGKPEAKWVLHRKLLTDSSNFARAVLKHGWKEKDEMTIRWPEETPGIFDQFVKFIYTGCIMTVSLDLLVQMYLLGDRLEAAKFRGACLDTIARTSQTYTAQQIQDVLANTTSRDPLRKLCIEQVARGILEGIYKFAFEQERDLLADYMPELMQGVIAAVSAKVQSNAKEVTQARPAQPAHRPGQAQDRSNVLERQQSSNARPQGLFSPALPTTTTTFNVVSSNTQSPAPLSQHFTLPSQVAMSVHGIVPGQPNNTNSGGLTHAQRNVNQHNSNFPSDDGHTVPPWLAFDIASSAAQPTERRSEVGSSNSPPQPADDTDRRAELAQLSASDNSGSSTLTNQGSDHTVQNALNSIPAIASTSTQLPIIRSNDPTLSPSTALPIRSTLLPVHDGLIGGTGGESPPSHSNEVGGSPDLVTPRGPSPANTEHSFATALDDLEPESFVTNDRGGSPNHEDLATSTPTFGLPTRLSSPFTTKIVKTEPSTSPFSSVTAGDSHAGPFKISSSSTTKSNAGPFAISSPPNPFESSGFNFNDPIAIQAAASSKPPNFGFEQYANVASSSSAPPWRSPFGIVSDASVNRRLTGFGGGEDQWGIKDNKISKGKERSV